MFENEHCAEQVAAEPVSVSVVQALLSLQLVGQSPSHFSPASIVPLPQVVLQSLSVWLVHPAGQQPSSLAQVVRGILVHWNEHCSAEPVNESVVQAFPSSQVVGQSPSQVSPASVMPLPQEFVQSGSDPESQPSEQQPSFSAEHATGPASHRAVQLSASPIKAAVKHAGASSHDVGQAPSPSSISGSQASPGSSAPFPHLAGSTIVVVLLLVLLFVELFVDELFEIFALFFVSPPQETSAKDKSAKNQMGSFVRDAMGYLKIAVTAEWIAATST